MITIYCVGKIKEPWMQQVIEMYQKQGTHNIEIVEVADVECPQHFSLAQQKMVKKQEGKALLDKISKQCFLVALDLAGETYSIQKFDQWIQTKEHLGFVIGGSLGLDEAVLERANIRFQMSKMTFTHLFARMMLIELIQRK